LVEIAVDIDLEHRCRMVARATRLFRNNAVKAKRSEVECVDEGIDHANRIFLADVVVNRLWQKRRLRPIRALDEATHSALLLKLAGIVHWFVRMGALGPRRAPSVWQSRICSLLGKYATSIGLSFLLRCSSDHPRSRKKGLQLRSRAFSAALLAKSKHWRGNGTDLDRRYLCSSANL